MTERSERGYEEASTVSASRVIERPVSNVFAFYAVNHHRNHPRWDSNIELELETEGSIGVGTVIRRHNSRYDEPIDGTMEVTEFEENEVFGAVIREGGFEMGGQATFEELGSDKTKITLTTSVPDSIDPGMVCNGMEQSVQKIKELIESHTASPS